MPKRSLLVLALSAVAATTAAQHASARRPAARGCLLRWAPCSGSLRRRRAGCPSSWPLPVRARRSCWRTAGTRCPRRSAIRGDGVSLRSASGRPGAVVLDGRYSVGDLVSVEADDVVVAELTLTRSGYHLVHAVPPSGRDALARLWLYRLGLVDASQQFVKANPPEGGSWSVDRGRVECSSFLLTAAGRPHVSTVQPCYTGGIDVHAGRGLEVRLNSFEGIHCADGLAEHAVHVWAGSRGTLVERNTIVDCARGSGSG